MNTILNLQITCFNDPVCLSLFVADIKTIPLTRRIWIRGQLEQTKIRLNPAYFPGQEKRLSKHFLGFRIKVKPLN